MITKFPYVTSITGVLCSKNQGVYIIDEYTKTTVNMPKKIKVNKNLFGKRVMVVARFDTNDEIKEVIRITEKPDNYVPVKASEMAGILSEFFPKNISTTEYVRELRDL
jgi:hypothetical protein